MRLAVARVADAVRAGDWWDYKLLPIVQVFLATALVIHVPLSPLWPTAATLLAAIAIGAVFASLINDLTDIADDASAGKSNVTARMPQGMPVAILSLAAVTGSLFLWNWHDDVALCIAYLGAWMTFVAYSVPPLRLKARGGWGVAAMALGEAALPSIVAALLCYRSAGRPFDALWIGAVAIWALGHGARAILWHQLRDEDADRQALVETFVRKRGSVFTRHIAIRYIFPAEFAALAVMLVMIGDILPVIGLACYVCVISLRTLLWHNVVVVVTPRPRHLLLMQDYYLGYWPLAMLAGAVIRHPPDALVILVLLLLFPRILLRIMRDTLRLGLGLVRHPWRRVQHLRNLLRRR